MRKHLETIFCILRSILLATVTGALIFGPTSALGALNTATWDISGVSQADATFELISFDAGNITLNKTAFLVADGSELTDGATVPVGTQVDFMIFVNNENTAAVNNVNIEDILLAAEFDYVAGNMRITTGGSCAALTCDPAERNTLYTSSVLIGNEAVEASDVAGFTADSPAVGDETVSAGLGAGNAQLDLAADEAFALVFRVTVL